LLVGLAMLVLDFLLKLLLDLFLAISIVIVIVIVIILKTGEKFWFQGSVVARLGVRGEAALSVALLGQNCGFLQLLQLFFIHDREVLPLNNWLLIIWAMLAVVLHIDIDLALVGSSITLPTHEKILFIAIIKWKRLFILEPANR
jgi:hypothetical protein